ncbi:hypothetical protein [Lichenibacterium ramalinae]|uniref:Uncharacterized protein n=1 Tax=Lichenibacterium ramalinae TaxID=2316527 RepID=A0A4Q2RB67_9HYPH|nr:hypothetical protein [Lichenibacterium ramalinae]RYB04410.1 hypothetical protein D3272_13280 [Lichenibacterium ramalinae]
MSVDEGVAAGRAGGRVVGADRWRRYESLAEVGTPAGLAREVARHVRAAQKLEFLGDALAECAGRVAAVTALRLACTPSRTGEDQEVKAAAFDGWLASARGSTRAHLAFLLEAALRAEWRSGTAGGLPRPKRTTFDADSCGTRADGIDGSQAPNSGETTADDVALYRAAVGSADADVALAKAIDVLSDLTVVPRRSPVAQGAWAVLDEIAFGLCVVPSTSREDRLDKRRPLLILWRTVRRRPSTAAVLRRLILLDRQRWPGPVR